MDFDVLCNKTAMLGRIKLDEMVTKTMPLEDINRAFELMHEGDVIRSVILL